MREDLELMDTVKDIEAKILEERKYDDFEPEDDKEVSDLILFVELYYDQYVELCRICKVKRNESIQEGLCEGLNNRFWSLINDDMFLLDFEEKQLKYWETENINLSLQSIEGDLCDMVLQESEYLDSYCKFISMVLFNEKCNYLMQSSTSSVVENETEISVYKCYEELTIYFNNELQDTISQWEDVFCNENFVIFDDALWKLFVKRKPVVNWGGGWCRITSKKAFLGFNHNRIFRLKMNGWNILKNISSKVSFVSNINEERNNPIHFNLLKQVGIDGKVKKFWKFLERRRECFIKRATNLQCHQPNLLLP
jgi:hypothetical protein